MQFRGHLGECLLRYFVIFWRCFRSEFLQRRAIGGDRRLQLRRPAFTLPKGRKRVAQVVLHHGPIERDAFAGPHLQSSAIGGDRFLKLRRPVLALPSANDYRAVRARAFSTWAEIAVAPHLA